MMGMDNKIMIENMIYNEALHESYNRSMYYYASDYFKRIRKYYKNSDVANNAFMEVPQSQETMGGFEVYIMGVLIFSKRK